jgi:hypothetical protein
MSTGQVAHRHQRNRQDWQRQYQQFLPSRGGVLLDAKVHIFPVCVHHHIDVVIRLRRAVKTDARVRESGDKSATGPVPYQRISSRQNLLRHKEGCDLRNQVGRAILSSKHMSTTLWITTSDEDERLTEFLYCVRPATGPR